MEAAKKPINEFEELKKIFLADWEAVSVSASFISISIGVPNASIDCEWRL